MNDHLINDIAKQRHADLLREAVRDVQRSRALEARGRRSVRQWLADVARAATRPAVPIDQSC